MPMMKRTREGDPEVTKFFHPIDIPDAIADGFDYADAADRPSNQSVQVDPKTGMTKAPTGGFIAGDIDPVHREEAMTSVATMTRPAGLRADVSGPAAEEAAKTGRKANNDRVAAGATLSSPSGPAKTTDPKDPTGEKAREAAGLAPLAAPGSVASDLVARGKIAEQPAGPAPGQDAGMVVDPVAAQAAAAATARGEHAGKAHTKDAGKK